MTVIVSYLWFMPNFWLWLPPYTASGLNLPWTEGNLAIRIAFTGFSTLGLLFYVARKRGKW